MQPNDDQLLDLLEKWEACRKMGKEVSAEELAGGNDELVRRLSAAIVELKNATWMGQTNPISAQADATIALSKPSPTATNPLINSQLGPYVLLELLGQGGMGSVFKAKHTRLNKLVAIKVLPEHLSLNLDAVSRFEREMKAVGALEHPNIVRAMDANDQNGIHYLVMELVDGKDLQKLVREQGPYRYPEACRLLRDAALGLEHAHRHGLVHRDIKPSNLLVTNTGQLKILDLGLARLNSDTDSEGDLTQTGASMGTPDYMAPEQWDDSRSVDHRVDLYALGCTFYFLLIGRAPYATEQFRTVTGKMSAHAQAPIPKLTEVLPEIPSELDALCQKLLQKSANSRIQTASELAAELAAFTDAPAYKGNANSPTPSSKLNTCSRETSKIVAGNAFQMSASRLGIIGLCLLSIAILAAFFYSAKPDGLRQKTSQAPSISSSNSPDNREIAEKATVISPLPIDQISKGDWLNLLPLIDASQRASSDKWTLNPTGLNKKPADDLSENELSNVVFPALPRALELEIEVEFSLFNDNGFLLVIPASQGFTGVFFSNTDTSELRAKTPLNQKVLAHIHVGFKLDSIEVLVTIDGEMVAKRTSPALQSSNYNGRHFVISSQASSHFCIHSLRLKPVHGELILEGSLPAGTDYPPNVHQETLPGIVPNPITIANTNRWQLNPLNPTAPLYIEASVRGNHLAILEEKGLTRIYDSNTRLLKKLIASTPLFPLPTVWDETGNRLLIHNPNYRCQLWDLSSDAPINEFYGFQDMLRAITRDNVTGNVYAAGFFNDASIRAWDRHGRLLGSIKLPSPIEFPGLQFSSKTNQLFATLVDGTAIVLPSNLKSFQRLSSLTNRRTVAIHPDGDHVAFGRNANANVTESIQIWNIANESIVNSIPPVDPHELATFTMSFSPDGQHLAFGMQSAHIYVFDWQLQKKIADLPTTASVKSLSWSADSKTLHFVAQGYAAATWNPFTNKPPISFGEGSRLPFLSPDATHVAHHLGDGNFRVYRLQDGKKFYIKNPSDYIAFGAAIFSFDSSNILVGKGTLLGIPIHEKASLAPLRYLGHDDKVEIIERISCSQDGSRIASMGAKTIRVWSKEGDCDFAIEDQQARGHLTLSPDGNLLAVNFLNNASKWISVWDARTGEHLLDILGDQSGPLNDLRWVQNNTLAAITSDGYCRQWKIKDKLYTESPRQRAFSITQGSADSNCSLLSPDEVPETVQLRTLDGSKIVSLRHSLTTRDTRNAVFGKHGAELTIVGADEHVRTWDTSNGDLLRVFVVLPQQNFVVINPQGEILEKSPDADKHLIYTREDIKGKQALLTPEQFHRNFTTSKSNATEAKK